MEEKAITQTRLEERSLLDVSRRPPASVVQSVLSPAASTALAAVFSQLSSPYEYFDDFMATVLPGLLNHLSMESIQHLLEFRRSLHAPGMLIIRNLPVDQVLPETPPTGGRSPEKRTFLSEASLIGVGSLLGEIYGYNDEKKGELIHNICPVKSSRASQSNEGSEVDFRFHVEAAYFNFRPHFLLLLCLRSDEGVEASTTVAEIKDAIPLLTGRELEVLREPLFRIHAPQSFLKVPGEVRWSDPMPVFQGSDEHPEVRLNFNGMAALSTEADQALESLERALNSPQVRRNIHLEPGSLLIINNRKAVHGRTPFRPRFDGRDRWLQRIYVHSDPWQALRFSEESPRFSWS